MSDVPSPADVDREDGLPRVVDAEASARVKDALHNKARVRWSVTVQCKCGEEITLSSLTAIVKCDECNEEWEAGSALS